MDPSRFALRPSDTWKRPVVLLVVSAAAIGLLSRIEAKQAWQWIEALGPWAPVAFCLVYAIASAGMLPGSVLTLAAGAKWGPVEGLLYVVLASNLGANLAFGIGRIAAGGWVSRLVAERPRFAAVQAAVAADGWRIVLLLRLSPVFPFNVLNYALSLTRVSWPAYALASLVGMLPGTLLFVYLGSVVQAAVQPHGKSTWEWLVFGLGLAATAVVSVLITRVARQALQQRLDPPADPADPSH